MNTPSLRLRARTQAPGDASFLTDQPPHNQFSASGAAFPVLGEVHLGDTFQQVLPRSATVVSHVVRTYQEYDRRDEVTGYDVDGDGVVDLRLAEGFQISTGRSSGASLTVSEDKGDGIQYEVTFDNSSGGGAWQLAAKAGQDRNLYHWLWDVDRDGTVDTEGFGLPNAMARQIKDDDFDGVVDWDGTWKRLPPDPRG